MPRPTKANANYFPLDTDIFSDIKIMRLKNDLGFEAISVYLSLLCSIYGGEGYYTNYKDEDAGLFAELIGGKCEGRYVAEVVSKCLDKGLFDLDSYQKFGVLTSKGIQERFIKICCKRDNIRLIVDYLDADFYKELLSQDKIFDRITFISVTGRVINLPKKCLTEPRNNWEKMVSGEETGVSGEITGVFGEETGVSGAENSQSKVKESKVNESKSSSSATETTTKTEHVNRIRLLLPESVKPAVAERMSVALSEWLNVFPDDVIKNAIKVSLEYDAFNLKYIDKVLTDWSKNGIPTDDMHKKKTKYGGKSKNKFSNYGSRELDIPELESYALEYLKGDRDKKT